MEQLFTITFQAAVSGQLLREAIATYGISKRALTSIKFDGGQILVNGKEENVRFILSKGDEVKIVFPPERASESLLPETTTNLPIIYEDDYLLVVDKPPFMNTIPSREHPTGSVANYIKGYYEERGIFSTLHIVTRLDRDTSGLMCIAKHRHIHHLMSEMQKRGQVYRLYEAIVEGNVPEDFISIREPIGRKDTSIIEREVRPDGQIAHTDLTVIQRFSVKGQPYTHIRLKLYTGRTHQIRVHCAYLGYPLVGDELYGGSRKLLDRQALHCAKLEFIHPISKEKLEFECALPATLLSIMKC